jgi:hypothetical protein
MEQEADFFHLFTQHQFLIFVISGLLIVSALLGIGFLIGKRAERNRRADRSSERAK